jgi:hypothetical protein
MSSKAPKEYEQPSLTEFLSAQYHIGKEVQEAPDVEAQATAVPTAKRNFQAAESLGQSSKSSIGFDTRDDPFAPREGKTLTWQNVDMILVSSTKPGLPKTCHRLAVNLTHQLCLCRGSACAVW